MAQKRLGFLIKPILAALVTAAVIVVALSGFWSPGKLGISDWDYYFTYHTALRDMFLKQHVFPFWNPYICGGTAGLADPEFPVFTPTFMLELVFGVPVGLRLSIFLSFIVAAWGILALARQLKLSWPAAMLSAWAFSLCSANVLQLVEGHPNNFAIMWVPWVFLAWIKAYSLGPKTSWRPSNSTLLLGLLLALMFYQGGIFLLTYVGLSLLLLILFVKQKRHALAVTVQASVLALGLAAVKLVPSLMWLSMFPKERYASPTLTLPWVYKILLGRYLHGSENVFPTQTSGWHEYGAYIGPLVLALAFLGLARIKQGWVKIAAAAAVIFILISSAGPILKPFFDWATFLPRSNLPRIIIVAVLALALLAGAGIDWLWKRNRWLKFMAAALVLLAAADVGSFALQLSRQAFVIPPLSPAEQLPAAPQPIAYSLNPHIYRVNTSKKGEGVDYTRAYSNMLAGYGTLTYCSVLGPKPAVVAIEQDFHDYLGSDKISAKLQLLYWSPNLVRVKVQSEVPVNLVLNANYTKGWQVNDEPAIEIGNRLGASVPAGTTEATFSYRAPGWKAGLVISLATIIFWIVFWIRRHRKIF